MVPGQFRVINLTEQGHSDSSEVVTPGSYRKLANVTARETEGCCE